jgi:hypothetical protein
VFAKSQQMCISFVMSVRLSSSLSTYIGAAVTGRLSVKFDTEAFRKMCQKSPNLVKIKKKSTTLQADVSGFQCWRRHKFAIKPLSSNEMVSGC